MLTNLYIARVTNLGADSPSEFYFDEKQKAIDCIKKNGNGDLYKITIASDSKLVNYSDGCCYNDLVGYNKEICGEKVAQLYRKSIPFYS